MASHGISGVRGIERPDVIPTRSILGLRPLLVVLSLAYLLGLLAVDAVIDTADSPVAFFHYYCVLLDSLTAWPQVRAKHISFLLGSALGPLTV